MIAAGTIVVRTKQSTTLNKHTYEHNHGAIVKALGNDSDDRVRYGKSYAPYPSIPKTMYRMATRREIDAYRQGIRNIRDMVEELYHIY